MAKELAHAGMLAGASREEALNQAIFALNNQRAQEAERIAGEVLKADPRHAKARQIFGHALLMQGRTEEAIAVLEPAARGQGEPQLDTLLAMALGQVGRHEDALSRLRRVTKRRPPFPPAFLELGRLLQSLKRHDEAIEAFKRGVEIVPTMPELSIQLGYAFLAQRESASAKAAFAKALQLSPEVASALWGMGKAHQQLGENEDAVGYFRRCLRQTPDDAGTWLNLGHSLLEAGDVNAGFECFRTAARGDQKRYFSALTTLVKAGRGRFWLKPSAAVRALRDEK